MALKDLYKEIDSALAKYPKSEHYNKVVADQAQRYVHETYFTKEWINL